MHLNRLGFGGHTNPQVYVSSPIPSLLLSMFFPIEELVNFPLMHSI